MPDSLIYRLKPELRRMIAPMLFVQLLLGCLLYLGIYSNLKLLGIKAPSYLMMLIILSIAVIILADTLLIYKRLHDRSYDFHDDRLILKDKLEKHLPYYKGVPVRFSRNFIDRLFNTITVYIGNIRLMSVKNSNSVLFLIQKLVRSQD